MRDEAVVNKITWQKAGHVAQPGRYMFTFGWLTVTAADLRVWEQFPEAAFTLVRLPQHVPADAPDGGADEDAEADEFHLGAFEIPLHAGALDVRNSLDEA